MIEIDAAMGGVSDAIGRCIEKYGHEDSSGLRRAFLCALVKPNYEVCGRLISGVTQPEVDDLRALAVKEFGEPKG